MERTSKQQEALDRLLELYVDGIAQAMKRKLTQSMRRAHITLALRYWTLRERLEEKGVHSQLRCVCKIDRVVFTTGKLDLNVVLGREGFRATTQKPKRLWKQNYAFTWRLKGSTSIKEMFIAFEPTAPWFAAYQVTVIPKDECGLEREDLNQVLSVITDAKLALLEFAFDFPASSIVDLEYVLKYGLFGKTWWTASGSGNPFHSKCGSIASKIVRAYIKWEMDQFRIELELHTSFLRKHGVGTISDFPKLADALVPDHISFKQIDDAQLKRALRHTSLPKAERKAVFRRAKAIARTRLNDALKFLRGKPARLSNTHRFLVGVHDTNEVIRKAAQAWATKWRSAER